MIEIIVEHFFTTEGQQRFPVWIREIEALVSRYPGFIDIRQMTRLDEPDRCFFRMSFQTRQDAQRWTTSSDRRDVLALMQSFRLAEIQATRWLTSEARSTINMSAMPVRRAKVVGSYRRWWQLLGHTNALALLSRRCAPAIDRAINKLSGGRATMSGTVMRVTAKFGSSFLNLSMSHHATNRLAVGHRP
ncbi:hypothetical protein [Mycobacterium montefiorense]|uniref:hypothetical protein n=1 Tax=Mycobacterium montefiorense TaxID=154654 RepID=UPI0021F314F5|nr:hypothetical protein [Mycobacterium montefiorense]MCV7427875.1 hypothetical protein [Mycobacterium montefiorense]